MRSRALIIAVGLVAASFAAQDSITLARTYKEGEKDNYKLALAVSMSLGSADVSMNMAQTIKKVYENGDADIETLVSDMHVMFGGNEVPSGSEAPKPRTQRVDKFGKPVGAAEATGATKNMMEQMAFLRAAMIASDKPLVVGASVDVDRKEESNGTHTWGKVTLEKVEAGIATIQSDLQQTNKATGDKPMNLKFKTLVETASAKLIRVDGTVTNIPAGDGGMQIDSVVIKVERQK